jgi:hypothetical protein
MASPETSLKQVFQVKRRELFIIDPNLVRPILLVIL